MSNEKPKLTEEQVDEIFQILDDFHGTINDVKLRKIKFKENMTKAGYMKKPETAFERAERLCWEWRNEPHPDVVEFKNASLVIDAFRKAISEMAKAKEAAK